MRLGLCRSVRGCGELVELSFSGLVSRVLAGKVWKSLFHVEHSVEAYLGLQGEGGPEGATQRLASKHQSRARFRRVFHVEHSARRSNPGSGDPMFAASAMQAKEDDQAKDDGSEQDLSDVIVEDLLVGVGCVAEVCLLLCRRFTANNGIQCLGHVLFYIHVLDSLSCSAEISLRSQRCSWGVPQFPGARVFITKVPLHYNNYFAIFCRVISKTGLRRLDPKRNHARTARRRMDVAELGIGRGGVAVKPAGSVGMLPVSKSSW